MKNQRHLRIFDFNSNTRGLNFFLTVCKHLCFTQKIFIKKRTLSNSDVHDEQTSYVKFL